MKWPNKNGPFVWKTQVGVGEASPVVVREKVFIVGDGIIVRCLDKATGKVVWERKRHARADAPAEQKMAALEEAVLLFHESRPLCEQVGLLKSRLGSKNAKFTEAEKAKIQEELAAAQKVYEPACSKLAEFPVKDYGGIRSPFDGAVTYSIATQCSDGERLYVYLPTGAVVCYDLAGQRLWFRVLGDRRVGGGWGDQVGPSPALGDGKLIVHYDKVYCFEAKTGKELWAAPNRLLPIASPIIGHRNGVWYVAVGSGEILRLADGHEVFRNGSWKTTIGAKSGGVGGGDGGNYNGTPSWRYVADINCIDVLILFRHVSGVLWSFFGGGNSYDRKTSPHLASPGISHKIIAFGGAAMRRDRHRCPCSGRCLYPLG